MFSLKKLSAPAVTALLIAVLLPAAGLAAETATKSDSKKAAKSDAKPAAKSAAKPAAKAAAKPTAKAAVAPVEKTPVATDVKEPVKEAAKEPVKEPAMDAPKAQPVDPGKPVVKINGTTITRGELDRAVKVLLSQSQVKQPLAPEEMQQAEAAALDQLAAAELLYQEGVKMTIDGLDKKIAEKVAQNRAKFKSEAEFAEALKSVDMTAKDMDEFTRKEIVISNYIEKEFTAKSAATEAEVKKFYDENVDQYFKKPEMVRASHVLISVDANASAEDKKKAKEKAEAVLKRIKGGEDFAAVAKAESTCPSFSQGGDLGVFGRGQMVESFENAAFALKPGEVSGLVESQFGFHVIKVTEKQESTTEKLENVKDKIAEFLKLQKVQQQLGSVIEDLKKKAKIEKM